MIFNDTIVAAGSQRNAWAVSRQKQLAGSRGSAGGGHNDRGGRDPGGPSSAAHPTLGMITTHGTEHQ